jgi:hypothetical protein
MTSTLQALVSLPVSTAERSDCPLMLDSGQCETKRKAGYDCSCINGKPYENCTRYKAYIRAIENTLALMK